VRATVLIDRGAGVVGVREFGRRRIDWLPLATVAEMVAWRCARAEGLELARETKRRRALRGKGRRNVAAE